MNVAVPHNFHTAITGVSPNFTLNYPKITFSEGKLDVQADVDGVSLAAAKDKVQLGTCRSGQQASGCYGYGNLLERI